MRPRPDRRRPAAAAGGASAPLAGFEDQVLGQVDEMLARGRALRRFWRQHRDSPTLDRFDLAFTFNRPDSSWGFFGEAPVGGAMMPVLGNLQEMFYDQPKSAVGREGRAARGIDRQLREFVLRYFMRVSDFRDPQPYSEGEPERPPLLAPLSWCFGGREVQRGGFGYEQLFYRRAGGGEIGRFPESRRHQIVDLREIGPRYEWIVVRVNIFDFRFVFAPLGVRAASLDLPLAESSLLVLSRDFISDRANPAAGVLGHYGLGYAFLRNPEHTLLAWGPGKFDAAWQTIDFEVLDDGRIRVEMAFVANRPRRVANLPPDPVLAGAEMLDLATGGASSRWTAPVRAVARMMPWNQLTFDPVFPALAALNAVTGGLAGDTLCIRREQIEKRLILTHFTQHYNAILGSLQTWRQVRDWTDEASLPRWVVTGESV